MRPHDTDAMGRRFLLSIGVTFAVLIAEVAGGFWTGSLALVSDSAHVFMDVFALALSYLALRLSAMPADDRHTYGYHRLEVLAALANGATLCAIAVGIFTASWQRWQHPQPVKSLEMLTIAAVGLAANLVVAYVLGGRHVHEDQVAAGQSVIREDLNVRSAFLHVVGDAISSVGVIVAALILWRTGWTWVDPLMSALIGALILVSSLRVLKGSLHILVEGVPEGLSLDRIGQAMDGIPRVLGVHDLHVWSLCSGHVALSAHIVTGSQSRTEDDTVMAAIKGRLSTFGIEHTTIQFEGAPCGQGPGLPSAPAKAAE